jgi:trimeric autotransporter adhesin
MKTVLVLVLVALCTGCGGYGSSSQPNTPSAGTTPNISALVPNSVNANSAAFVLTVNGTSFNNNAQVKWNGTGQTTTFVTGSQLTINVPASLVTTSGTVQVTVTNPATMTGGLYGAGTTAQTSTAMTFTIN